MDDKDKIYWTRAAIALLAGILSPIIYYVSGSDGLTGILMGIAMYLASYYIVKYGFRISVDEKKKITANTIMFNGIGTYILIWIFTWTLILNLFPPPI